MHMVLGPFHIMSVKFRMVKHFDSGCCDRLKIFTVVVNFIKKRVWCI